MRRKVWQPSLLLLDRGGIAAVAGQTDGHVLAEPEGAIVPALAGNGADGQAGPLWKLGGDQPARQRGVDLAESGAIVRIHGGVSEFQASGRTEVSQCGRLNMEFSES